MIVHCRVQIIIDDLVIHSRFNVSNDTRSRSKPDMITEHCSPRFTERQIKDSFNAGPSRRPRQPLNSHVLAKRSNRQPVKYRDNFHHRQRSKPGRKLNLNLIRWRHSGKSCKGLCVQ